MDLPFLPYGAQTVDDDDIAAVTAALRSPFLTTGPRVAEFEHAIAGQVGAQFGVAVSNGTAALHAACHALGLGPEDEVVVPAVTFLASANCVRYVGARPVFADVCPDSGLMTAEHLEAAITPRTRAVIPVHLTGRPVDLSAIRGVCERHGLHIIEDAAHALGARYDGQPIGSCGWSEMAIFSFHPVKHLTTGEGGMIVTNDGELDASLRCFRSHGMVRNADALERPSPGPWYYEQHTLGFNYRITDIQCALGLSQLKKLDHFVARRQALASRYDALLDGHSVIRPIDLGPPGAMSAYHLYSVLVDFDAIGMTRAELMTELRARGIGTQVHYIPVPYQPYYQRLGWSMDAFPGAQRYYDRTLSLPLFPRMADEDVDRTMNALDEVLGAP